MNFITNGADWCFTGLVAAEVERLFDRALSFIADSADRGEVIAIGDDFQERPMHGTYSLWELYSDTSPVQLSQEIWQEISAWLSRAPVYLDSGDWPAGFEDTMVSVDGAPFTNNPDLAWVHYSVCAGIPVGCFTLGESRASETVTAAHSVSVCFVGDESGRSLYWRSVIALESFRLDSLLRNASRAYPNLYFVDGVVAQASGLAGGYTASRQRIHLALVALNDWGHWAFTCAPPAISPADAVAPYFGLRPTNQLIEQRFAGLGLDAAPENPNVYNDRACREARETKVKGKVLYCEWHIKLEPHRNRIHFHPPVHESDDRVIVGMISEHLPLP